MASINRIFSLDEELDRDIIEWINERAKVGKASESIRNAIRLAMDEERVSLSTILQEIRDIKRNGLVYDDVTISNSEPADIAKKLEELGL